MSGSFWDEVRAVINPWPILAVLSIGLFVILLERAIVSITICHFRHKR